MIQIPEGVYLEVIVQTIGTGGTARKNVIKNFYIAKVLENDLIQVQLLDMNDNPMPIREKVDLGEFNRRFQFQPDYFDSKKKPEDLKISKALAQAEAHYQRKEYYSAEYEYGKALKLDEDNVRANFGVAKVYLATGEKDKARETFQKLAKIDAVFELENKHIFNELGIELRRLSLYKEAIDYYRKALSISKDDENLFFNISRACFEQGDLKSSYKFLAAALKINPDMVEAKNLMEELKKKVAAQRQHPA